MFRCVVGKCRLDVCLVFVVYISEFVKLWSLFCDTNVIRICIYCDSNGKVFNYLNMFLQHSLLPRCIIILCYHASY
jgi:hypothetical protein